MFYTSISNLLRRTFLLSLFFGAGIFLVTTVLFFERERFVAPLLKEYLTEFVRSRAGAEFEIGEIRGNYYSELHFSMVRFASPRAPLRSLRASSLRVHYWLPALASGIEPFLSTIEIIASGGELDMLFAKKGKGASSKISQKTRTPLPWIPKLKGDDFSVKLARGRESVFLAQASFDTAGSTKEEVRVQVRAPDTKITSPFLKEKTFSIDTEFSFSRGRVLVRHAIFNNQVVTRSAEVTFGEEHPLHLRGLFEVWGGKIRLDQRVEAGILQGRAEFHSIDLAKIHRIISLKSFPEKGTAFFDIDISTPVKQLSEAKGSLRAHFEGLQVNGIFIEEVRFKGRVTEDQLFVENALFHAGENRVAFEEVLLPKKSLKQGKFFKNSESFSGKFNATLLDVPEFVSLLKGKPLKTAFKAPRHELSFLGNIKKGTFHFEKGVLKSGGSTVEIRRAELPLFRRGTDPAQVSIGAEGRIRINDLKDFSDLFNLPKMTGSLAGEISLNGTLADPTGTFRLKGKNIRRKSVRFDTLNLQGEAGKKRVTFSKIKAFSGKDTLEGSGAYDIAKNRIKQTKLIVDIHNVSPYLALVRPEWKKVSGRFKGVAEGSGAPENPRIVASAVLEKWVQPDFSLYSGKLTARLENQTLDLGLLSLRTTEGTLSAILSFSRLEKTRLTLIRIPTLSFLRDGASFALLKPALISLDPSGKIFLKNISFAGSPGRVDLSGMLNSNHEGDIKVVVNGRSSESIPDAWMPRRFFFEDLTFTAHLTGSFSSPEISVSGEVKKIGPSKDGLILKGMYGLTASSKGINITQFNFSDNDGHRINLGGKIPFGSDEMGNKPQGLSIDADVNLDEISPITSLFLSPPVPKGQMVAKISIRGTPAEPLGEIHLHTKNFTLAKLGFFPFLKNVAGDIDLHTDTRQIFLDKVSLSS
ncbi:MAG: hypothetical protein ACE5FU_06070, partial [Nitrospinota bacterium]